MNIETKKQIIYNWLNENLKDEFRNAKYMTEVFNRDSNGIVCLTMKYTKTGQIEILTKTNKDGLIEAIKFNE